MRRWPTLLIFVSTAITTQKKSVQFSFTGNAGVYCVSRIQKGKISEVKKVIIK
jgi:hypothetical protein